MPAEESVACTEMLFLMYDHRGLVLDWPLGCHTLIGSCCQVRRLGRFVYEAGIPQACKFYCANRESCNRLFEVPLLRYVFVGLP